MRLHRSLRPPPIGRRLEGRQAPKFCRPSLQQTSLFLSSSLRRPYAPQGPRRVDGIEASRRPSTPTQHRLVNQSQSYHFTALYLPFCCRYLAKEQRHVSARGGHIIMGAYNVDAHCPCRSARDGARAAGPRTVAPAHRRIAFLWPARTASTSYTSRQTL